MLHKLKTKTQGFTIIEVLIVLAIAALILLIVFLAVPSLQRNSRNTQLRNDSSAILGYVNEYASNNNGAIPGGVCTTGSPATGDVYLSTDATCTSADTLGGKIRGGITVTSNTTGTAETALQEITIALTRKCNGANPDTANSNARAFSSSFRVETAAGGTGTPQCVES